MVPYPSIASTDVLRMVEKGYIMEKPENCPDAIYEIMQECWNLDPQKRPSMQEIGKRIGAMYREFYKNVDLAQSNNNDNESSEPLYNSM